MTKHPVTRWYRLAIAAVVPLVLTVCYTPPDAIDSISDLGNVEVEVPSTTALAAAEPVPPVRPEMAVVDPLIQPDQPAPDAGLIGPDGTATLAARTEPPPPRHPAVLAVVPMGEVGVPGTPVGVGADGTPEQAASVVPPRPDHPVMLAVAPLGEVGVPGTPVGVGADGTPEQAASVVPPRPDHPVMLAVAPLGEVGVPGTPVGVGADGTPEQAASVVPPRPDHPVMLAVAPLGEVGVPGTPVGVGADGTPEQAASVVPPRPDHPVMLTVAPLGEVGVPGTPVGVGADGTPEQAASVVPPRPDHPVMLAVAPLGEVGVPGTPVGVGADGTPEQAASVVPPRPDHPVMLAVAPLGEVGVPGTPVGVGADGTPEQAASVVPARPGHPSVDAVAIGVPGEIGVPVGVGEDGTPLQVAFAVPPRPGHPSVDAVAIGIPGEIGVPVGVGEDGTPMQVAFAVPARPGHPSVDAVAIGVPGEIGVPVGVGEDGMPMQVAFAVPARPGHPSVDAVAIGVPGEIGVPVGAGEDGPMQVAFAVPARPGYPSVDAVAIGLPGDIAVPLGAGTGESPQLGAQIEPPRPPHPELLASVPMAALVEPGAPASADGADAVRDRAGVVPPLAPPHPALDWSVPAVAVQPAAAGAAGPSVITGPTDADFDRVRVLIARAEEVDADFYDPENLNAAREALALAERIRASDPVGSHVALAVAEARATEAFENAVRLTAERLRKLLAQRLEELREIQADLWVPVSFQEMVDAVQRVEELFAADDLFGAYELALATADAMLALRDSLLDRLELLYGRRAETERCLAAAQKLDTSTWTASRLAELQSLYDQLNALYLVGLEAMQSYRLADAEEAFGAAVEVCRRLMAVADDAYMDLRDRAAALMKAVMEEIEEASELHVITETGDVIRPQPWDGQEVLDQLRAGGAQRDTLLDGIGREGQNDLQTAQGLWMEGVVEFDDEKYGQAISLFEDARRYLERYKFYVVLGIHTVRLIPERRESLWRIAEYPQWYGDPFLWPRIWRRNRDLIQNPDLIYPGWQLIIPAI